MDVEPEELQLLGIAGIFAVSARLIVHPHHRRLFSEIALTLVLPISLLFLAHIHISHLLFSEINRSQLALDQTSLSSPSRSRLLSLLSSEYSLFLLFKALYLLFLLVFSLLSTSAVVFSVASIFSNPNHGTSFHKLFTVVVPNVWKRLVVTFLYAFALVLAYNVVSVFSLAVILILMGETDENADVLVLFFFLAAYLVGIVWISVVWHLASVVSVLEDMSGIGAMRKSRNLIKGNGSVGVGIFLMFNSGFGAIEVGFRNLVVKGSGTGERVGYGMLMSSMLMGAILLGLVVQSVVYFVCKSYHHESIDKPSLSDHLEVYLGEYVPLKEKDVQMEQYSSSA